MTLVGTNLRQPSKKGRQWQPRRKGLGYIVYGIGSRTFQLPAQRLGEGDRFQQHIWYKAPAVTSPVSCNGILQGDQTLNKIMAEPGVEISEHTDNLTGQTKGKK